MNSPSAPRRPVVLIADDEPAIRALLLALLAAQGVSAREASSGHEAAEVLRRNAGEIGLALVDLAMPGLSGLATLAALKRIKPSLRLWAMSAGADVDFDLEAAGACGVLLKPFTSAEVTRWLVSEGLVTTAHRQDGPGRWVASPHTPLVLIARPLPFRSLFGLDGDGRS